MCSVPLAFTHWAIQFAIKDEAGRASAAGAKLLKDTKSGTPGADSVKIKGVIT